MESRTNDTTDQIVEDFKTLGWVCKLTNPESKTWTVSKLVRFSDGSYNIIAQFNVNAQGCWVHLAGILDSETLAVIQRLIKICQAKEE